MSNKNARIIPGVLLALAIAVPAWALGKAIPIVGGPVFGILLGMGFAFWKRPAAFNDGIRFTSKKLLQLAVILLGFEMNLFNVVKVGKQSLYVMLFTLSAAFLTAWLAGRALKLRGNTATLIGVGTAICGGSAIAATAPVINADDEEVAYSISTIFLFNVAAVFIFPLIGHLIGMGDTGFGMWAGTAINDTSSVVAAGYSYSDAAGNLAVIVKLTRTLMIVPVTLALAVYTFRKPSGGRTFSFAKIFPWFVLGFLTASVICTTGILPAAVGKFLALTGKFLIITAMAAIGLNTHLSQLVRNGVRPILLGFFCWLAVAVTSLAVQWGLSLW